MPPLRTESFQQIFARILRERTPSPPLLATGECRTSSSRTCTLCHASAFDYAPEAEARNQALQAFWGGIGQKIPLRPLLRSPLGRHYRTTSKRKAYEGRNEIRLALIDPSENGGSRTMDVKGCAIEPADHAAIYTYIQESIRKPFARPLAGALRYAVIRGNYAEQSVIFTVGEIAGAIVRAVNTLSKGLTHAFPHVRGVMLFEDRSDGRYYLGTRSPSARGASRKVFGDGHLYAKYGGKGFLYSPLAFSQINGSLVDEVLASAGRLLRLTPEAAFFDLYCGYGLFTLALGPSARSAVGIERSPESIEAAIANGARLRAGNVRFVRCEITEESLGAVIAHARPGDAVLLDPARGEPPRESSSASRPGARGASFIFSAILI